MKLFWDDKPFYRGNTHCHTTRSDGRRSPEEVIALYREAGYDFLALTDHRKLSEQEHFEENLLMIPGMDIPIPRSFSGSSMSSRNFFTSMDSSPQ